MSIGLSRSKVPLVHCYKVPLHETYENFYMQACRSFSTSSMLVRALEGPERSRALISLGLNQDLAGYFY